MILQWITRVLRVCIYVLVLSIVPLVTSEPDTHVDTYSRYVPRYFTIPVNYPNVKQRRCLIQAIYYEAGNQSAHGKEAVALVILNRVSDKRYPRTICGVVRQSHIIEDKRVCQFSFWCEERRRPIKAWWKESEEIAERVLNNYWHRDVILRVNGALYFHANYVKPAWRKQKVYLGKIGDHLFYGEKPLKKEGSSYV